MQRIISGKIPLHTFQCRKNEVDGDRIIPGLFKKLFNNKHLNVLNLKENKLLNENAEEMEEYSKANVYIEEIMLLGNRAVHASVMDEIDNECR